jgi:hypothetical protein
VTATFNRSEGTVEELTCICSTEIVIVAVGIKRTTAFITGRLVCTHVIKALSHHTGILLTIINCVAAKRIRVNIMLANIAHTAFYRTEIVVVTSIRGNATRWVTQISVNTAHFINTGIRGTGRGIIANRYNVVAACKRIAAIRGTRIVVIAINRLENAALKWITAIIRAHGRIDTVYAYMNASLTHNARISGTRITIVAFQVGSAAFFIFNIYKGTRTICLITTVRCTWVQIIANLRGVAASQEGMARIVCA